MFERRERIKETSILLRGDRKVAVEEGMKSVIRNRIELEGYIRTHPEFLFSLDPLDCESGAPKVVKLMARAGKKAGVGPMAAVAGAIAELATEKMIEKSSIAIAENGGDISIMGKGEVNIGVYSGEKAMGEVGIRADAPAGVCTSSGTVGHSISFGCADAVTVICERASVADAFATAIANQVKKDTNLRKLVQEYMGGDVRGILIIRGNKIAFSENLKDRLFRTSGRKKFSEDTVQLS